jgi:MFS family permease
MSRALPFRLSVMMFLQWAVPGALVPLYSVRLEQELGFGRLATAACCATQAAATVLSSLVAGQVADRWLPAEKAMSACAALAGLDLLLLARLHEPVPVFLATFGFWLFTGPMLVLGTAVSFTHLGEPHRQFGKVRLWGTVGWIVVGWLLGTWSGDPLHLGALVAFLLAGYALTLPHTPPRPGRLDCPAAPVEAVKLLRRGPFAVYCACALVGCVTFPFTTQNTPLLLRDLGIDRPWLTPALSVAQTTEVLGLALLPGLLLRLGLRGTMALGLGAWLAAMCVLAVGRPAGLVVASLGLNGVYVTGFLIAGQVYVNGLAGGDLKASVQGLLTCVNGLGLLVGNLLAGWLRERSGGEVPSTFAVAAVLTAAMLLVFLAAFPRAPASVGEPGA